MLLAAIIGSPTIQPRECQGTGSVPNERKIQPKAGLFLILSVNVDTSSAGIGLSNSAGLYAVGEGSNTDSETQQAQDQSLITPTSLIN